MNQALTKLATKVSAASTTAYLSLSNVSNVLAQGANHDLQQAIEDAKRQSAGDTSNVAGKVFLKKGYASDVGSLITSVLTFVMLIAALLILMYLIWGGIQWITSGGDKGKTEEARNKITSAVIGLIILAAAWAVFLIVLRFLGFESYADLFTNITSLSGT